jgi:hypothetical protein
MPFNKYLQDSDTGDTSNNTIVSHNPLGFQIPQFIYAGPPTLAPGGGAEVLPFNGSPWFINNSSYVCLYFCPIQQVFNSYTVSQSHSISMSFLPQSSTLSPTPPPLSPPPLLSVFLSTLPRALISSPFSLALLPVHIPAFPLDL